MQHSLTITSIQSVTHNVRQYRLEKPEGFHFEAGQATEVSIDKDGWRDEKRPFTFTCLNDDALFGVYHQELSRPRGRDQ